jgi:hypothetical protein
VVTFVLGHNSLCSTRREFSPEPLTLPGDRAMLLQCSRPRVNSLRWMR